MKKVTTLLFLILIIFISYACPDNAYDKRKISFRNSSEKTVSVILEDGKGGGSIVYPDTMLPMYNIAWEVPSMSSTSFPKILPYSQDSIYLFVLDPDTIAKYPWEKIREDYNIIKRYGLSWKKLQEDGYKVYYP